ncbi:uracil DNA glycosylase superfamily protein [Halarchaeum acidiphilum MH1-52-1]|uniref:Uracil DNA glycosylase superfamily protein n=1 Tax=Halarchaeum acidiphilum MH1-52-1 TaxID=1261545 RepID=U2YYP2_9EURY|nr:uracil-DNA glycosylase family protein [Halarchaeum acidiphilum]GAD53917.1 uracil DNA glycosylase superfamily protein [Halarchaeum acidiphilum MH1-52-1]
MENVTDRTSNPFGMRPDTDAYVPGYGDANADFHVVGDHPGAHGGADTGVPFTGTDAAVRLQHALAAVDLVTDPGDAPGVDNLFLSYRHMGVLDEERSPTAADYAEMEPFFDAELRAITAHVLLPVGRAATEHVLEQYTARREKVDTADMAAMHGTEIHGSGFLVVPVRDPREWETGDDEALATALAELMARDYRRESDLGRFLTGPEPYRVR